MINVSTGRERGERKRERSFPASLVRRESRNNLSLRVSYLRV